MPRIWRVKEARKNEYAIGGLCLKTSGKNGRRIEKNSKR